MKHKPRVYVSIAFCVVSILHSLLGFYDIRIPAWAMFKFADRYAYTLLDNAGTPIRIRDYVMPRNYVINDDANVVLIALWLAEQQPRRMPFWGCVTSWSGLHPDHAVSTHIEFRVVPGPDRRPVARLVDAVESRQEAESMMGAPVLTR